MPPIIISVSGENTVFTNDISYDITKTEVVLATGWTEISANSFSGSTVETIYIPSSVTTIGNFAFSPTDNLTSIIFTIDSSLATIGEFAFQDSSGITNINIPSTVTSIGRAAFQGSGLHTVYMTPETLDTLNRNDSKAYVFNTDPDAVSDQIFYGKANVVILNVDKYTAFVKNYNDLKIPIYIDISGTLVETLYSSDISINDIVEVIIGENVTIIGSNAFQFASQLEKVTYTSDNSNLTSIESSAFSDTIITEITIPGSVETIGNGAFKNNSRLNTVEFVISSTALTIGNEAFQNTSLASIDIPLRLSTIKKDTFGNTNLTNIYIPYTITEIEDDAFSSINNLTVSMYNVTIEILNISLISQSKNPIELGINDNFYGAQNVNITTPSSSLFISRNAENQDNPDDYTTNDIDGSTSISSITSYNINLGTNVIIISDNFLVSNDYVEQISIPNTVISIGVSAFEDVTHITEMSIPSSVINIDNTAFNGMNALNSFIVDVSNNFFTSVDGVLFNNDLTTLINYPDNKDLTQYDIPDSVTTIGPYSFQGVSTILTTITIPSTVTDICNNAFTSSNINNVIFDESTNIDSLGIPMGTGEFYDISANVSFITKVFNGTGTLINATQDLSGGTRVDVYGYSSIGADAFLNATTILDVELSNSVNSIGDNAFKNATSLSSVSLSSSVTSIGAYVFSGTTSLSSIYIPPSLITIDPNALSGSSLTTLNMLAITSNNLSLAGQTSVGGKAVDVNIIEITSNEIINRIYNNLDFVILMKTRISRSFITEDITSEVLVISTTNKYIQDRIKLTIQGYEIDDISIYNKNLIVDLVKTNYAREIGMSVNNLKVGLTGDSGDMIITIDVLKTGVTESMVPICFPAGTLVTTDQGDIPIEKLQPDRHTVRGNQIIAITQTTPIFKYITCIQKDALGMNIPNKDVHISNEHKVFYKGKMTKAVELVEICKNVTKIPYNGEILYNVLLGKHDKMMIHNLICETLDPENIMAKICKGKHSMDVKNKIYMELNKIIKTNNIVAYKNVCDYLSKHI